MTDDITAMRTAHRGGVTIKALAEEYGVHRETVGRRLKAVGCTCGQSKIDETELGEILKRYQAGESCASIGPDYGVDPSTIANSLKRAGHQLRPRR